MEHEVRYRTWYKGLPPQPIKLKIPGWAGDSHGHKDGDKPQPWHCIPFVESSTYGLELIYPYDTEVQIVTKDGKTDFIGDLEKERPEDTTWPPFSMFAPGHYGFTSSVDLIGPPDHSVRIECHPRYFTDTTWQTPCVVPGHIQSEWWPRIFFIVFKAPPEGQKHVFRKGQGYAQLFFVPRKVTYDVMPMTHDEMLYRLNLERKIMDLEDNISDHAWTDHIGNRFNDKYKVLQRAFTKGGLQAVEELLHQGCMKVEEEKQANAGKVKKIKKALFTSR